MSSTPTYRRDIQGMRAVAVLLVMLWHAGFTWLPGGFVGVDVFFVISGFLMTGLLIGELEARGRVSLGAFYARRARRLLPASLVLIAAVLAMAAWVGPRSTWNETAKDALASTLFGMNWRLAHQSSDYLEQTTATPSLLRHYWSLSVEEQFYFLFPLVLVVVGLLAMRLRIPVATGVAVVVGVVGVASLGWAIHLVEVDPGRAYFVSTTRVWELLAGTGVYLAMRRVDRVAQVVAGVVAWVGLGMVVASGLVIDPADAFPSWNALLPVGGTALALWLTPRGAGFGPGRLLGVRPLRAIGDWSYSLYLWHWPLVVVTMLMFGPLTATKGAIAIAVSFLPAVLSYRFVEEPFRRRSYASRPTRLVLRDAGLALAAAAVLVLSFWSLGPRTPPSLGSQTEAVLAAARESADPTQVGAAALDPQTPLGDEAGRAVDDPGEFIPTLADLARTTFGCSSDWTDPKLTSCSYGDEDSPTRIVLAGDSHALHWAPTLVRVAQERDVALTLHTKNFCPVASPKISRDTWWPSCEAWQEQLAAELRADPPSILVLSQYNYDAPAEAFVERLEPLLDELNEAGTKVVILADTPQPPVNIGECVGAHQGELTECDFERGPALERAGSTLKQVAEALPYVTYVDLNDAICPVDPCAPVIGKMLVYVDSNHMTYPYAESLAPRLDRAMATVFAAN